MDYGTENEKYLDSLTTNEATQYMNEGYFAEGAMLPKVNAAVSFVNEASDKKAIITKIERAMDALSGKTGTIITK